MNTGWEKKNITRKLDLFSEVKEMSAIKYKDFRLSCGLDLPSLGTIISNFGTWNNFKKEVYEGGAQNES
jgi:hypothetical protein